MSPENIASGLRNMVDDIESLGAAPLTVDTALLRQAIAALTPPEGFVLVPVEMTEAMQIAGEKANRWLIRHEMPEAWAAMLAARPEVP